MPDPLYKTGKSGKFLIGATNTFFSEWNMSLEKTWANATDSSGFDATSRQLWRKQAAGSIAGSGSIKGFYDFNAGSSSLLAVLLADAPVPVTFQYDVDQTFGTGLVTIKNFQTGVVVEGGDTIGFTCDFDTYGVFEIVA